jgi:hypothetical protein
MEEEIPLFFLLLGKLTFLCLKIKELLSNENSELFLLEKKCEATRRSSPPHLAVEEKRKINMDMINDLFTL